MKTIALIFHFSLLTFHLPAQTVTQKLQKAFTAFEKDIQLAHAISSLYVIDAQTGNVVFDKNSRIGLAPASTQKVITSVTAFELLGKDYKYKTEFFLEKKGESSSLIIKPSGDPTFGSWRWIETKQDNILSKISNELKNRKVNIVTNTIIENSKWESVNIPDGWIWQDIGNYYGAAAYAFNWRENQFDIVLKSGKNIGDSVEILSNTIVGSLYDYGLVSEAVSAAKGTGDNAYVYFTLTEPYGILKGTIPINEDWFKISATMPNPDKEFFNELNHRIGSATKIQGDIIQNNIYTHYSPSLDSIIYWFNKKSINLYGEALIKTFAYEKQGFGSTDSGVSIVQKFWKEKGLSDKELNIVDGSGLSPLNRVTTHAQVEILKYAKNKDWFPSFYNSLPEYNGMKMKSGTIHDVKGFCGYHKAKNGKEYIFSFLVNNYNGSAGDLVKKMYKVLDNLK
jgi:D-alanyl-D-alanine carboxypeptidase/D-alanyl-D-alanine-endopeptidase (penicillin-binding protein 4)